MSSSRMDHLTEVRYLDSPETSKLGGGRMGLDPGPLAHTQYLLLEGLGSLRAAQGGQDRVGGEGAEPSAVLGDGAEFKMKGIHFLVLTLDHGHHWT